MRNIRGIIVFTAFTVNTLIWFTPLFLLAIVKLIIPISAVRRPLTSVLMSIGENWISVNAMILSPVGSGGWNTSLSERIRDDGWYLVMSNHQTWVDIVVLQTAFNRRIPFLKFFIKQQLIWFPLLGIAWWALDMPFMKRYSPSYLAKHPEKKGRDLEATRKACEKFKDKPTSVINFVEGTRFTAEKRDKRRSPYRNLLMPRAGGIAVALDSMGHMFDAVLDVTIYYPDGPRSFWEMCCGDFIRADIHVEERSIDDSLLDGDYTNDRHFRKQVHAWLADIWADKDARLDQLAGSLQVNGHSPSDTPVS
ncbi:MAG: acyltransferase [Woeseiaceae bacterium]|nr:acyltransferase [Woeseiaceae bacterium]